VIGIENRHVYAIYILYIWYIVITTVYMVYINYRDSKNTTGYNLVVKSVIPGSID